MIEKLEKVAIYEGTTDQERLYILRKLRQVVDKINEIIDHLPQEKEDNCESCVNYCKGERDKEFCPNYLVKQPIKEPQEKEPKMEDLAHTHYKPKQPTEEVPDIQRIKEILLTPIEEKDKGKSFLAGWVSEKQLQEISALYRKENV